MAKTQKVQMPAGIRNKLMAAVCMLLVSSIMMVSTTYAWFTLSTAPEVTGITTSVGANGNLEMALLTTESFKDLTKITSAVGNSSAVAGVKAANATWGNLVDLSDASYGLQNINLLPARLSFVKTVAEGGATTYAADKVNANNLLLTPTYGADGRVATVDGVTYAAAYDTTGWKYVSDALTYGVRAIGANENLTAQQAGLIAAKAAYTGNLNSAKSAVQTALSTNGNQLASAITTMAMGNSTALTTEQVTAVKALVAASNSAINYIDAAYKQVLLAYAASAVTDTAKYTAVAAAIDGAASYSAALDLLTDEATGITVSVPSALTTAATTLATQKTNVTNASGYVTGDTPSDDDDVKAALKLLVDTEKVKVNGFEVKDSGNGADDDLMVPDNSEGASEGAKTLNGNFASAVMGSGAVVEMPNGSGVFAYVGSVAGNYSASCKVDIKYGSLDLKGINATMKTTATVDNTVTNAVNGMQAADASASGTGNETFLSDTYGYALDFAFRTNAAGSYLQLQTAAAQRVYGDSSSAVTQGSGSNMSFTVGKDASGNPLLKDAQVTDLMKAVRVAFIDPGAGDETASDTAGKVYGIAALENITVNDNGSYSGELYLQKALLDTETGLLKVDGKKADDSSTAEIKEDVFLMNLEQSIAKRLTVVVYLDGDLVDNGDVANAAQSLVGSLNLQFSSSATLIPMKNTALQTMQLTYTKIELTGGKYTYNGVEYTVVDGKTLYKGNDGAVYFADTPQGETPPTEYTKLTATNMGDALVAPSGTATPEQTKYTVTFDPNGGSGSASAQVTSPYTLPASVPEGITAPNNKQFKGWSETSTGEILSGSIELTSNKTLYAIWEETT